MINEVEYGLDAVELIVRISAEDVNVFNSFNELSFDQLKQYLGNKESDCIFQKLNTEEHRVLVPLEESYLVLFVKEHPLTCTYEAVVKQKNKTCIAKRVIIPEIEKLHENVKIRFIDINEGGRNNLPSAELEALIKKINQLPVASVVNIGNQQEIWNKWIEAQKAILKDLQKPYEVKNSFKIQEIKNSNGDVIRYSISFDHANEILPEYGLLEKKLKQLDIDCRITEEGSILLNRKEIEVLDAVIKRDFSDSIERSKYVAAIISIKPERQQNESLDKALGKLKYKYNEKYRQITLDGLKDEFESILNEHEFIFKQYRAEFEVINHGNIITNEAINEKYNITFGSNLVRTKGSKDYLLPQPYNNKFVRRDFDKIKLGWFQDGLIKIYGKENIITKVQSVFELKDGATFNQEESTEVFWQKFKRELFIHNLEDSLSSDLTSIYLEFTEFERIFEQLKIIEELGYVRFVYSPKNEDFKFKLRINVSSKKTQREMFLEKLKMLRGADFILEIKEEGKRRLKTQYLGTLNGFESDLKKIVLNLPFIFPDQKKKAKEALSFLKNEQKPVINKIRANLVGDSTKMEWLQDAVDKITNSKDTPNGKPVNSKLGEFIFDTSKADPIFDEKKLEVNSEEYQRVRANELLKLNETQRKAVISAINCTDLALLQGPPGTGKTTVIAEMIWQIISREPKHRILLTSETNLAVDNALDRLLNTKGVNPKLTPYTTIIKPLRFGRMSKMDEEGAKYSVERILAWSDPNYVTKQESVLALDERDDDLEDDSAEKNSPENNAVQDWMKRIAERARNNDPKYSLALKDWAFDLAMPTSRIKKVFTDKYFEYSNIIGSTCSSAGSSNFMWDYAKHMLHKDTEAISKLNFLASKAPFGKELNQALREYDIPQLIILEFERLLSNYREEERKIRNYFAKNDKPDEVDSDIYSLQTIDGFPIKKQDDRERLVTAYELIQFSLENIAPYFEEKVMFDTVIMDEASKATPPELLLPLCFGKRSIVIGDHRQLPPMLNEKEFKEALKEAGAEDLSNEIDREFTETSQFERMILNPKVSQTIISRCNIQYRMHPDINEVIKQFYLDEGGLEPATELIENANDKNLTNPFSRHHGLFLENFIDPNVHTIWVNVNTPESRDGTSITNEGEIQAIKMVIELLKKSSGFNELQKHWDHIKDEFKRQQEQQIGIISFYGAQKRLVKRGLAGIGVPLKINTVDRFQGMERNIIIVSTVRSHLQNKFGGKLEPNKDSGFAKSPQRLNVALSRARRLLIVVGNKQFFEQVTDSNGKPLYKNAIEKIEAKGRVIDFETLKKLSK